MALISKQFTYDIGGQKEQFDGLFEQGDRGTPVLDRINGGPKADSVLVEWDTEGIETPAANAKIEGADFTYTDANSTTKLSNRITKSFRSYTLSLLADSVKYAGRQSELKRKMKIAALALRQDMELMILQTATEPVQDNGTNTAGKLAGIPYFIQNKGGVNIDNTSATFLEADLREAILGIRTNGGSPEKEYVIVCTPANADAMMDWASVQSSIVRIEKDGEAIDRKVMTWNGNNGSGRVLATPLIGATSVLVLSMDTFDIMFSGSPLQHIWKDKPKGGQASADAYRGVVLNYWTIRAKNPTVNAEITITPTP